jgi:predicted O-methyltransferase YrrM
VNEKINKIFKKIEKLEESQCLGSVPRSTGKFLNFLILATKSKKVLEIGCSLGYSTIWMALALKRIQGHIYTTEIHKKRASVAKKLFSVIKMDDYITLLEADICEVLSKWNYGDIDFVFMDANEEDYLKHYELVFPFVKKGGIIIADDVIKFYKKVNSFLEKVNKDHNVVSQILDFDDGLMLIYKK